MTTYVSSAVTQSPNLSTAALFRSWFQKIYDDIVGSGALVQTSDTGQVDISTMVAGAADADVGWHMFRFNDSLQGTDPIFVKLWYGRGNVSGGRTSPRLRVETGQGTDGAGTLTGITTQSIFAGYRDLGSTSTSWNSYIAHGTGYVCVATMVPGITTQISTHFFVISRTRDLAGSFDGRGVVVLGCQSGTSLPHLAFARRADNTSFTYANPAQQICLVPGLPASTALLNGDLQLYPHFYADPDIRQSWPTFTVRASEFPSAPTSFLATPIYGEQRTFLSLGNGRMHPGCANDTSNFRMAFLWE